MNAIKRYFPSCVDSQSEESHEFATIDELFRIPFVSSFARDPSFFRFSVSDSGHLMAEYNEGAEWWVVGAIKNPDAIDLPMWDEHIAKKLK